MSGVAQSYPAEPRETFWRPLQTLNVTRVVISIVLLAYLHFNNGRAAGLIEHLIYQEACIVYLLLAIVFALVGAYWRRRFLLQLTTQIVTDIAIISLLYATAGGAKSGLAILYLFPLAGAAILAPLVMALSFVSIVTLFLLGESSYRLLSFEADATTLQAGLYGAAFFATVLVLSRLAARLIRQEELAAKRGQDLQIQLAINRLVIADMEDGILVVGRKSTVFTANPAAQRMLGWSMSEGKRRLRLSNIPSLVPIAEAFFAWQACPNRHASPAANAATFVFVKPVGEVVTQGGATIFGGRRELKAHLRLRFATVSVGEVAGLQEECTVIFLQNVTDIENQAQQLKLASMGRLTASIAHEVRNPLSAIGHAAALLGEDVANPMHLRLLKIVGDNVGRVNQMVEDILKLSRKVQTHGEPFALQPALAEIVDEFQEVHALPKTMVRLSPADAHRVRFDPLHLREVVVNLLTNAIRYASGQPASIRLQLLSDSAERLELHVQDDGPGITPEVRAHLFEPFYTTSSKGTGLGLYLARELCLNNGAMLDYEYRLEDLRDASERTSGRFVITFAMSEAL